MYGISKKYLKFEYLSIYTFPVAKYFHYIVFKYIWGQVFCIYI